MKLYINRTVHHGAWGGGNLWVKAAYEHAAKQGHEVLSPEDFKARPNVILLAGVDGEGACISAEQAIMYKMYVGNVKLILRVNENDARKATHGVDEKLMLLSGHVDGVVFVSEWLQEYFTDQTWNCKNNTVIHNGVDREIFKPSEKLNNGKINLVTHHWSNNDLKGFDIYDQLDKFVGQHPDKYTFTYIGRDQRKFQNTKVVQPLYGKALGDELGKYDVYISASRFDPGPNHVLESLACEIPTYVHKDGGGGVEFAGKKHVYGSWNELQSLLEAGNDNQTGSAILFQPNITSLISWETSINQYLKFCEDT